MKASKEGLLLLCLSGVLALAGCENGAGDYGRSSGTEASGTEAAVEGKQTGTAAAIEAEQPGRRTGKRTEGENMQLLKLCPKSIQRKWLRGTGVS